MSAGRDGCAWGTDAALGWGWWVCTAGGARDRTPVGGKRAPVPSPAGVSLGRLGGYFSPEAVAFQGQKEKKKKKKKSLTWVGEASASRRPGERWGGRAGAAARLPPAPPAPPGSPRPAPGGAAASSSLR